MGVRIQGERVVLRPLTEDDIEPLARALQEPGVSEWWAGYDAARLREETLGAPEVVAFAVELDGGLIGLIQYVEETDPAYRAASIDITLDARHLGQGLGTDALRALARYLFEERGHHRLTIDPAADNARAIAAYRKVGFRPVGVMRRYETLPDGTYRDGLLMDLLAEEFV